MIAHHPPPPFFVPPPPARHVVLRTRPFRPRLRPRPRPWAPPLEHKPRHPLHPAFAPQAVLKALSSSRPKLPRPRPAWASLPVLPSPTLQEEAGEDEEGEDENENEEAEVETLLAFASGLDVEDLDCDDMQFVPRTSPSPLPQAPSVFSPAAAAAAAPPIAPHVAPSTPAAKLKDPAFHQQACSSADVSSVLQAVPPSPPLLPPPAAAGPVHSARSAAALFERRFLATVDGEKHEKEKSNTTCLHSSPPQSSAPMLQRRRGGGGEREGGAAAAAQEEAESRTEVGVRGGIEGGRPLEMPRMVVIDEEGGLRRVRRLSQLPYWHENPALKDADGKRIGQPRMYMQAD